MQFTRKGYIEVWLGEVFVSRHTSAEEAYESAYAHAESTDTDEALYVIRYPHREMDLSRLKRYTRQDQQKPTTPVLTATASPPTTVNLSWTAATDNVSVAGYRLYYSLDQVNWTLLYQGTTRAYSHTGLGEDTYYYRVNAYDPTGNNGDYATANATLDLTAPTTPNLVAESTTSSTVSLSWTASADNVAVTGYTLQRSGDNINWTTLYSGLNRTYSDSGLSASSLYYYRVRAQDAVPNYSAYGTAQATTQAGQSGTNTSPPAVYPLELVSPRAVGTAPSTDAGTPTIPSGHRIFKAYPGIEYNIRAVVIGGSYPYTFSLSNAPTGMTINSSTGEISWPNPQANATPTITVRDSDGTELSSSWTITVTTSGFVFVNAAAAEGGTGSISSPWNTLSDVHASSTSGQIVYFRAGTYSTVGISRTSIGSAWERVEFSSSKSTQWIAYPGESVTIDQQYAAGSDPGATIRMTGSITNPCYVDGISFTNVRNILLQITPNVHYIFLRNVEFSYIRGGADGDNPSGVMYVSNLGSNPSYYGAVQDIAAHDLVSAGAFKTYSQYKFIAEDVNCYNSEGGSDIKAYTGRWEVRGCTFNRLTAQYAGLFGNMNQDPAAGLRNNGEVRYNLFLGAGASNIILDCNQDGNSDQIDIYRNTFVTGITRVRSLQASGSYDDGPFRFYSNVIVNESSTIADRITKLAYSDMPSMDTAPNVILGTANGADRLNNLTGGAAAGIVDANGNLTQAYASYRGTHGWEIP